MPALKKPVVLSWTHHAQAKMQHYRLSQSRVRSVLYAPKRVEDGVAPNTIAMMQPTSMRTARSWTQEIWVMVQDAGAKRKVISAWRYPGVTKPRGEITGFMQKEYREFVQKGGA